jgi:serine/threonine-protein kinase
MTSADRRARIDDLFAAALELPAGERSAYLAAACDGRPELRAEVEELLGLAVDAGPGLDRVHAVAFLRDALAAEAAVGSADHGRRFGAWQVVGELGRGGMGTVYLVERADGQFRQQAALKLVRFGAGAGADPAEIFFRFELERQILASLNHANIARLLDGGRSEDGLPYLVMEYVQGRPIDRYCDEERLRVDDRLELFASVGRAVQHAHRNLVVHRDVKPTNIAVTVEGEVKLLDFGIAKLLAPGEGGSEAPTRAPGRILTPEYASPEQVRGEAITTASDVYQLGLLLSELLTGQRAQPIAGASPSAVERAVCERPAVRPSVQVRTAATAEQCAARRTAPAVLARRLRGDLDAIVLFALRKEPERRYASVADLLDDIDRHRGGRPVRARPDTVAYRLRKLVLRRRAALAWILALALAAGWGVAALTAERLRSAREARRAEQVEEVVESLFNRVYPHGPQVPATPRDYVDQAARLVRTELQGQPRSQAWLLHLLGEVDVAWGFYAQARPLFEEALALRARSFGPGSAEVADSLHRLAETQHYLGRYDEAERSLRRALRIRRQRFGGDHPVCAQTALVLGDLQHTRGRLTLAEATLREAVATLRHANEPHSVAVGLRDLGNVLRDRGDAGASEGAYREALAIQRAAAGDPQVAAITEMYLARLLVVEGRLAEAEPLLAGNLVLLRGIYDGDHPLTATILRDLGYLRLEQGRLEEAEATLAEAQGIHYGLLGADHPMVARTAALQAEVARRAGHPAEAVRRARAALEQFARLGLQEHPVAVDACRTLGGSLLSLGRRREAAATLAPCLAVAERQFVAGDRRTAALRRALATSGASP